MPKGNKDRFISTLRNFSYCETEEAFRTNADVAVYLWKQLTPAQRTSAFEMDYRVRIWSAAWHGQVTHVE